MRRRSRASSKLPAQSRKAKTLKAARRSSSSASGQETEVARLTRERDEALERETANSEILKVISSSPGDLKPVFEAMLTNATRLCEAKFGLLYLYEEGRLRFGAAHSLRDHDIREPILCTAGLAGFDQVPMRVRAAPS
jgi:Mrp family chromosome partitioning ATPase